MSMVLGEKVEFFQQKKAVGTLVLRSFSLLKIVSLT
nr:MAG TPA: hypothetical protein [Caudoviricetes sp.]